MKPVLPEWARVLSIFFLTFALVIVLSGLAGLKINWVEAPVSPEMLDRP